MANYSSDIIDILSKAPEGLSIRNIARHVYNRRNTFFEHADMEDIKMRVTRFVTSRSRTRHPIIVNAGRRGVYKLNDSAAENMEMSLCFDDIMADDTSCQTAADTADAGEARLPLDFDCHNPHTQKPATAPRGVLPSASNHTPPSQTTL